MKDINMLLAEIEKLLDTTHLSCQEIADYLNISVDHVNEVVECRWEEILKQNEMMQYAEDAANADCEFYGAH